MNVHPLTPYTTVLQLDITEYKELVVRKMYFLLSNGRKSDQWNTSVLHPTGPKSISEVSAIVHATVYSVWFVCYGFVCARAVKGRAVNRICDQCDQSLSISAQALFVLRCRLQLCDDFQRFTLSNSPGGIIEGNRTSCYALSFLNFNLNTIIDSFSTFVGGNFSQVVRDALPTLWSLCSLAGALCTSFR